MASRSTKTTVIGIVLAVVGAVLIISGMGPLGEQRDDDGYYLSDPFTIDRPSYAVVSDDADLLRGRWETLTEASLLEFLGKPDDVRGVISGSHPLFAGIAATSAVNEYLDGVARDEITEWEADLDDIIDVGYTTYGENVSPPGPPGDEQFWAASVEGTGPLTLDWQIESGDWTLVIMNADASAGVTAEPAFGARPSTNIQAIALTLFVAGLVALIAGGLMVYFGERRRRREAMPPPPGPRETEPIPEVEEPMKRPAPTG